MRHKKEKNKISSHLVRITLNLLVFFFFLFLSSCVCGIPESPGNGSFSGNEFTLDSKVTYDCNEGFKLDASQQATAVCQEDGLWSNRGKPPHANVSVRCSAWLHRFKEQIHGWELWPPQCKILSLSVWAFVSGFWSCYISLFRISRSNHQHKLVWSRRWVIWYHVGPIST